MIMLKDISTMFVLSMFHLTVLVVNDSHLLYLSSNAFDNNEWICIFKTKSNGVSSIFTTFSWSIARAQCQELE